MKRRALCMILGVMSLMMLAGCMKEMAPGTEEGFLVRIAPSGKVINAAKWDGSEVRYHSDEKKRLPGAKLAFFAQGEKEPQHLKKVDGKWKKQVWEDKATEGMSDPAMDDVKQGIVVHVAPEGDILRVTNYDGTEVQYAEAIDFTHARIATKNYCCWKSFGGYMQCLCQNCPWGCPK